MKKIIYLICIFFLIFFKLGHLAAKELPAVKELSRNSFALSSLTTFIKIPPTFKRVADNAPATGKLQQRSPASGSPLFFVIPCGLLSLAGAVLLLDALIDIHKDYYDTRLRPAQKTNTIFGNMIKSCVGVALNLPLVYLVRGWLRA